MMLFDPPGGEKFRLEALPRSVPSMRRPVSVKVVFLPLFFSIVSLFAISRAASVAILQSALFSERFAARCQLGVLVSAGAAT
jgi:hypothetical protein